MIPYEQHKLPKPKLAPRTPEGDYKRPPRDRYRYVPDYAATLTKASS
jgi:hypothetical protein